MPFLRVNSGSASSASVYTVEARKLCVRPSVCPTSCIAIAFSRAWMNASASGPSSIISPRASSSDIAKPSCSADSASYVQYGISPRSASARSDNEGRSGMVSAL